MESKLSKVDQATNSINMASMYGGIYEGQDIKGNDLHMIFKFSHGVMRDGFIAACQYYHPELNPLAYEQRETAAVAIDITC